MSVRTRLFATSTLALIGTAALAAPASAQVQTTANPAPSEQVTGASAPDQRGLGEIIVTAQRQSENSQRAAVPLNVIQGSALLASGVTQVDGLNKLAPALSIQPTNTGNLVFVRGVGNFTLASNSDPAIAFNYDGVYVGRPTSTTGVFYDLDRVEILKGPQGILYGRNATAGAINILPVQPKLGQFSAYASTAFGNYESFNAEGAINVPLGNKSALRLSASRSSHDGYLSDGTSDEKTWAARGQIKTELTPDLTIRIAGDYAHNGGLGSGIDYQGVYFGTAAGFRPSGIPLGTGVNAPTSQAYLQGLIFAPLGNHLPALPTPFRDNSFYGGNAEISYKTGAGTLTVIPAVRYGRLNYLADAATTLYYNRENDRQYSLEARFAGTRIGPFDYQIGGYFFDERLKNQTELTTGNLGNYERPTYKTRSYAGFGRLTLHVGDRLRLVGGLRYTQDNKKFSTIQLTSIIVCTRFVAGRPSCPTAPTVPLFNDPSQLGYAFPAVPGSRPLPIFAGGAFTGAISIRADAVDTDLPLTNHKLTYRAAAEFDVGPRSLLYGSVESGYRSGGFSVATGFNTYEPETITAYTIGMKNRFLDNRVQANIEAFLWEYRNQQVTHVGLDLSGKTAIFTQNIGSSSIKGFELDGRFLATPTTLLSGDVQYLDTKQKDFVYQQGPGAPPIVGCAVSSAGTTTPYVINCSGLPSYNSPKWTLNLSAQQTFKMDRFNIVLSADTQYRSSRYIGFQYLPQQLVGSSWASNAQIQLSPSSDRWSIAAYVRNIENNRVAIYSNQGGAAGLLSVGTTAPRTYGIRLSGKI